MNPQPPIAPPGFPSPISTGVCAAAIAIDAPCVGCGYNLRGLFHEGHCPECRRPVRDSAPPPASVQIQVDEQGRLAEDAPCHKCGYNLRGLPLDGRCPECDTAVGRSVSGNWLRFCDPQWVQRLANGAAWLIWSIAIGMVLGLAAGIAGRLTGQPAFTQIIVLGSAAIASIAYWIATTPDPGSRRGDPGVRSRDVARSSQLIAFVAAGLGALLQFFGTYRIALAGQGVAGLGSLAGMVAYIALFVYARQLALRIPNEKLARGTRTVMWGVVVTQSAALGVTGLSAILVWTVARPAAQAAATGAAGGPVNTSGPMLALFIPVAVLGCGAVIASIVFSIWTIVLLGRYRRHFTRQVAYAQATWAADAAGHRPA